MQHPGLIRVEGGVLTSQQLVTSFNATTCMTFNYLLYTPVYITWWIEFFFRLQSFNWEYFSSVISPLCRLAHLYQSWRYRWHSCFYWFYIILDATTYTFRMQLYTHPCFQLVFYCSCCNFILTRVFPALSDKRVSWYPPIKTSKRFN